MGEMRRWEDLNMDCLSQVFNKVELKHLLEDVPFVCKTWYRASLNPRCWTNLDFKSVVGDVWVPSVSKLIKLVVNRSSGNASKVVLHDWCNFEDLDYVSDKCPLVRDLTVPSYCDFNEEWQFHSKLIGKFKELQILNMSPGYNLVEVVTEISNNCNNFEELVVYEGYFDKEVASATMKFLPNIKRLILDGVEIPRESLICILDGCRNLVLLDVQNCIGFDEDDQEILQRASHIKTFRSQGSTLNRYADDFDGYGSLSCEDLDYASDSDDEIMRVWKKSLAGL